MTLHIGNIWRSLNKILTIMNVLLLGLILMSPINFQKAKEKKIRVVFNVLLLLMLAAVFFIVIYSTYKRENQ